MKLKTIAVSIAAVSIASLVAFNWSSVDTFAKRMNMSPQQRAIEVHKDKMQDPVYAANYAAKLEREKEAYEQEKKARENIRKTQFDSRFEGTLMCSYKRSKIVGKEVYDDFSPRNKVEVRNHKNSFSFFTGGFSGESGEMKISDGERVNHKRGYSTESYFREYTGTNVSFTYIKGSVFISLKDCEVK